MIDVATMMMMMMVMVIIIIIIITIFITIVILVVLLIVLSSLVQIDDVQSPSACLQDPRASCVFKSRAPTRVLHARLHIPPHRITRRSFNVI